MTVRRTELLTFVSNETITTSSVSIYSGTFTSVTMDIRQRLTIGLPHTSNLDYVLHEEINL